MLEGFFMKYIWSVAGSLMIAIPAFFFEKRDIKNIMLSGGDLISSRTQDYITSKKLLMSGAEAIERLMLGKNFLGIFLKFS